MRRKGTGDESVNDRHMGALSSSVHEEEEGPIKPSFRDVQTREVGGHQGTFKSPDHKPRPCRG